MSAEATVALLQSVMHRRSSGAGQGVKVSTGATAEKTVRGLSRNSTASLGHRERRLIGSMSERETCVHIDLHTPAAVGLFGGWALRLPEEGARFRRLPLCSEVVRDLPLPRTRPGAWVRGSGGPRFAEAAAALLQRQRPRSWNPSASRCSPRPLRWPPRRPNRSPPQRERRVAGPRTHSALRSTLRYVWGLVGASVRDRDAVLTPATSRSAGRPSTGGALPTAGRKPPLPNADGSSPTSGS